jgi:hypothetical protein
MQPLIFKGEKVSLLLEINGGSLQIIFERQACGMNTTFAAMEKWSGGA